MGLSIKMSESALNLCPLRCYIATAAPAAAFIPAESHP